MQTDNSSSGTLTAPTEGVSRSFTEITFLHQTDVHVLYRAKRFGRWYMLKALHPDVCSDARYAQMLRKEMEILMQLQSPPSWDAWDSNTWPTARVAATAASASASSWST